MIDLNSEKQNWINFITDSSRFPLPILRDADILKALDAKDDNIFARWGFCYHDLSTRDLSHLSLDTITRIPFGSSTIWPPASRLPKGFEPSKILTERLDAGLNIKALHKRGITGHGQKCIVIDHPVYFPLVHEEISSQNITLAPFCAPHKNWITYFHAECVLANLCGKNLGIAPEAEVEFYYDRPSLPHDSRENLAPKWFDYQISILENIVQKLESGEKIAILSISGTPLNFLDYKPHSQQAEGKKLLSSLYQKIESLGCAVLTAENFYTHFTNCDISALDDFSDINSCKCPAWRRRQPLDKPAIIAGGKVVPEYTSVSGYKFEPHASESWSIPQVTGLFLLAKQASPNLSFEEFTHLSTLTAQKNQKGLLIFNPEELIQKVSKKSHTTQKIKI